MSKFKKKIKINTYDDKLKYHLILYGITFISSGLSYYGFIHKHLGLTLSILYIFLYDFFLEEVDEIYWPKWPNKKYWRIEILGLIFCSSTFWYFGHGSVYELIDYLINFIQ